MTVLITGGAGFIGTRLSARLAAAGDVVAMDNLHPQVHGDDPKAPVLAEGVEFVRGDVTDADAWDRLLERIDPDVVVHLAAETGTGQSLLEASRHTHVNVHGTAVMLDSLSRAGKIPSQIILTSSRAVYGEGAWRDSASGDVFYPDPRGPEQLERGMWLPTDRHGRIGEPIAHSASSVTARPTNVYAATKLAQENILTAWTASMDSKLTVARLQNVYGAGQALRNPYTGVLTFFARQAISGVPLEVFEGGGIIRDFVHVSDVVAALAAAVETPPAAALTTVDIGSDAPGTLLDFARIVSASANGRGVEVTDAYRLGDVRAAFADNSAAAQALGYAPRVTFEDGVQELLEWAESEMARGI